MYMSEGPVSNFDRNVQQKVQMEVLMSEKAILLNDRWYQFEAPTSNVLYPTFQFDCINV